MATSKISREKRHGWFSRLKVKPLMDQEAYHSLARARAHRMTLPHLYPVSRQVRLLDCSGKEITSRIPRLAC